tara:strand:+ start:1485 stop:2837 length:1353 start_codon:yes stop_codon:yes gene_type:complete
MPVITTLASLSSKGFSTSSTPTVAKWFEAIALKTTNDGTISSITSINNTPYIFGYDGGSGGLLWRPYFAELNEDTGALVSYKVFADKTGVGQTNTYVRGVVKDTSNNTHVLFDSFLLVKYDSSGTLVYNKLYTGTSASIGSVLSDLIIDSSNNLYVFSFNSGNFILTKIDSTNYTVTWSKVVTMTVNLSNVLNGTKCLYIDNADNIYVTVFTSSGTISTIIKFDTSGSILWQKESPNFTTSLSRRLDFDSDNNIYLLAEGTTATVVKLDSSGTILFTKSVPTATANNFLLTVNSFNNVVILASSGVGFFFTCTLDSNGTALYNTRIGDILGSANSIAVMDMTSINGGLYVTCRMAISVGGYPTVNFKLPQDNKAASYNTPYSFSYVKDNGATNSFSGTFSGAALTLPTVTDTGITLNTTSLTTSNFAITVADSTQTLGSTVPFEYFTPLI